MTELICAAFVKLSDSARSQNTFRLSICMQQVEIKKGGQVNGSSPFDPLAMNLKFVLLEINDLGNPSVGGNDE